MSGDLPVFPFEDVSPADDFVSAYAELRASCPVPKVRLSTGGEAYLVTRYEDTKRVLSDPVFSRAACMDPEVPLLLEGARVPGLMTNLDRPEHTRLHRLTVKAFTTGTVARYRPRIREIAHELVDRMTADGATSADFVAAFGTPFPTRLIFEKFGVPTHDVERMMHWLTVILSFGRFTPEEQATAFAEVTAYIAELVAAKRAEPGDDFTSALIQSRDEGDQLTEEELVAQIWVHLGGGSIASSNIIPNMAVTFARHPDQWELLCRKPELIPSAVEEVLRYVAAATTSFERMAMADVELSGTRVPEGSVLIPLLASANFDEDAFEDARRFDITRVQRNAHLGFGHGPHRCVGWALGVAELEIALEVLTERLPGLRLAAPDPGLDWDQGVAMRRLVSLPVSW
ncbi:cytochrome P450 [Streptacidiphilus monticola]|jgi:cytochrome P450|uniref:Cytochrome P450 n=1 Tax=Streptacidiphilus monticola TaxID=2161674 RepID=A0ABW1G0A8_9ACTN